MKQRQDSTGRPGLIRALMLSLLVAFGVALVNEVLRRRRWQPVEEETADVPQHQAALAARTTTVALAQRERPRRPDRGAVEEAPSREEAPPVEAPPAEASPGDAPTDTAAAREDGTGQAPTREAAAGRHPRPSAPAAIASPADGRLSTRLQEPLPPSPPPPERVKATRPSVIALLVVAGAVLAAATAVLLVRL
ncbi:MAG: hypothetical protein M3N57_03230 [Actinomycetota bacterium]|nr:hypothetical protein [Actinomycetota bacterium]